MSLLLDLIRNYIIMKTLTSNEQSKSKIKYDVQLLLK